MYPHAFNNDKMFFKVHFIFKSELSAVKVGMYFGGHTVYSKN